MKPRFLATWRPKDGRSTVGGARRSGRGMLDGNGGRASQVESRGLVRRRRCAAHRVNIGLVRSLLRSIATSQLAHPSGHSES